MCRRVVSLLLCLLLLSATLDVAEAETGAEKEADVEAETGAEKEAEEKAEPKTETEAEKEAEADTEKEAVPKAETDATCDPPCGINATCVSKDQCRCVTPFGRGNPRFRCYKLKEVAAEVTSDTVLNNFNAQSTQFYLTCRYLITHVRTKLTVNGEVIGNCTIIIFGMNAKADGKVFAHGVDAAIDIRYKNGLVKQISTSAYGQSCRGETQLYLQAENDVFRPNGPWSNEPVDYQDEDNGVFVQRKVDSSGVVHLMAEQCGVTTTFLPYDTCLKINQPRIPGISVSVDTVRRPIWLSYNNVLGLPPKSMTGGQKFQDIRLSGLSVDESLLVRAMGSGVVQNQPLHNTDCKNGQFSLCTTTSKRQKTSKACFWMLKTTKFRRCVGGHVVSGGTGVLNLFNECVKAACSDDAALCRTLKVIVSNSAAGCHLEDQEQVVEFLAQPCPF